MVEEKNIVCFPQLGRRDLGHLPDLPLIAHIIQIRGIRRHGRHLVVRLHAHL